eukprot:Lankesteria_metandrocarpae@DN994_c0_g1_i1.p1
MRTSMSNDASMRNDVCLLKFCVLNVLGCFHLVTLCRDIVVVANNTVAIVCSTTITTFVFVASFAGISEYPRRSPDITSTTLKYVDAASKKKKKKKKKKYSALI